MKNLLIFGMTIDVMSLRSSLKYTILIIKVCHFISSSKKWSLDYLKGIIPNHLIHQIRSIPVPFWNIADKLIWKFATDGQFFVNNLTNNDPIKAHPKAKLLSSVWKLNLTLKLFAWNFLRDPLLTRYKLRKIGLIDDFLSQRR